jgi:hypothetical protein
MVHISTRLEPTESMNTQKLSFVPAWISQQYRPKKNSVTFIQIKQRTIIKYLRFKGYTNTVIRNELKHFWYWCKHIRAMKYWATSFPAGVTSFGTCRHEVGFLSIISMPKFAYAWAQPVSSICPLADSLDIAPSIVHHHLTNVLHFRPFYLRCVPHVLTS